MYSKSDVGRQFLLFFPRMDKSVWEYLTLCFVHDAVSIHHCVKGKFFRGVSRCFCWSVFVKLPLHLKGLDKYKLSARTAQANVTCRKRKQWEREETVSFYWFSRSPLSLPVCIKVDRPKRKTTVNCDYKHDEDTHLYHSCSSCLDRCDIFGRLQLRPGSMVWLLKTIHSLSFENHRWWTCRSAPYVGMDGIVEARWETHLWSLTADPGIRDHCGTLCLWQRFFDSSVVEFRYQWSLGNRRDSQDKTDHNPSELWSNPIQQWYCNLTSGESHRFSTDEYLADLFADDIRCSVRLRGVSSRRSKSRRHWLGIDWSLRPHSHSSPSASDCQSDRTFGSFLW